MEAAAPQTVLEGLVIVMASSAANWTQAKSLPPNVVEVPFTFKKITASIK